MTIYTNILPSQVKALISGTDFMSGDTTKVVPTETDTVIDWGLVGGGFTPNKAFTIVCEQEPTLVPDPCGLAGIGEPPVNYRMRAVSPVTMIGVLNQYSSALSGGLFDFRNFNVKLPREPDWLGAGETWPGIGYTAGALLLFRAYNESASTLEVHMEDMHFEGPAEYLPSASDGFGDCPKTYYQNSIGIARADGAKDAANGFTAYQATGRGLWPGETTYRNKRFDSAIGTDVLYNVRAYMPAGLVARAARKVTVKNSSVRNLGFGINFDCPAGKSFDGLLDMVWFENLYGDWIRTGQMRAPNSMAQTEFQKMRFRGIVMTGCGGMAGGDLGNPHIDFDQHLSANGDYGVRIQIKNAINDVGAQIGKPNRSSMQSHFGGAGPMTQVKIYDSMIAAAQNKVTSLDVHSPHYERLQGLWVPSAPTVIDRTSTGAVPTGSGNLLWLGKPGYGPASRGLIKDSNAAVLGVTAGAAPKLINIKTGAGVPAGAAVDGAGTSASVAESYKKYRQPSSPYATIAEFLAARDDFSTISMHGEPAPVTAAEIGVPVTSALERLHVGDFDSTATIEMVTPGLEWREVSFDGVCELQCWTSAPGTVHDGKHLQLRATSASTASTATTFLYKIGGQSQSWSVTTKSAWKFPICAKPETGQWQRSSTGTTAVLPGAIATQKKKGIIWARFAVNRPTVDASNKNFLIGTSGRTFRPSITTNASGYSINWCFASPAGGQVGSINTGTLSYGVVYDHFFVVDLTLPANNAGLVVYDVANPTVPKKTFTTISQNVTVDIAWDYKHANNGITFADGIPIPEFHGLGVWAGESLLADDGTGTGTNIVANPGLLSPETLGINGMGLTGKKPALFLLGETAVRNRGTDNDWTSSATLASYSWANPPGQGPKLTLAIDPLPVGVTVGGTFTVTVRAIGSNEALAVTPTLGAGLTLVGGPSFAMAENARVASFDVQATAAGKPTISIANSIGYANPPAATVRVGA
ncbi:hypothetical protein NED98_18730 [Sphingomonas sp. MMSM20]|uniref:hypothetical protein n=1 Tax=Sphingomonas lycopersici TaxID=2951807 RepID=UPI00223715B7|nr:hypothetical protein [Sphingomonas lycopersici]MCW6532289.1 hypothetical protein [Sphingomonas lycopersici]